MKDLIHSIDHIATSAITSGRVLLYTDKERFNSNLFSQTGKMVVNFGSCSYLGLEFDTRLIDGAIDAIRKYGTQFSSSRGYFSSELYSNLEERLNKIFNAFCVITTNTSLGHITAIPIVIGDKDLVILDSKIDASVQTAVELLKGRGNRIETIQHNRIDLLEERLIKQKGKYEKIWYLADGISPMDGDKTSIKEIYNLLDSYSEFHFYANDAHGMSCYGSDGQGYVLKDHLIHNKMIVSTSLNKAFAAGGGLIILPTKELALKVKKYGIPMISSATMQPSSLGAAVACADIHLSKDINKLQKDLNENILYTNKIFQKLEIPLASNNDSPIFFAEVDLPKVGYNLVKRMLDDGFYTNVGVSPSTSMKNTGVRFTITKLHTFEQIENLAETMAYHYPLALKEEGYKVEKTNEIVEINSKEKKQNEALASFKNYSKRGLSNKTSEVEVDKSNLSI